ncbi:DMT family transporter [Rhodobacter sp. KR11]|uniref:DMT family transporter n=1 Tax=Rhodobacter sp. KR11 TaxID=2974588 RepID=UPI002223AC18|nr:DMT family transporter [Rhodobacter sp. KR11]MCW1917800.1 DMT family transporter [Rhodobacter sp. KR11]
MTHPTQARLTPRTWALMAALALIWGGSFTANHAALTALTVTTTVAIRVTGAALALWLWVALARAPIPRSPAFWRDAAVMGVTNNLIPFSLIVWGQTQIPSGLAGILNASTALFAVLIAALVFPDERLTRNRILGLILGLVGVVVTIGPESLTDFDPTSLGQLAILGAALSYGISGAYGRARLKGIRPEVSAAAMLTISAAIYAPLALIQHGLPSFTTESLGAVLYLALIASALAYRIFYTILDEAGAGNIGLVTLLIAPVAVILGALLYAETLPPQAFAGLALITGGLIVMNRK